MPSGQTKYRSRLLVIVGAALVLLLSPSAEASQSHGFSESFASSGSGAGQLSLVFPELEQVGPSNKKPRTAGSFIGADDETGEIYVADTANHRVSEFDPAKGLSERFVRAFGADVGGAGTDVCTSSCAAGTAGSEPGQLTSPTFIAVDNSKGLSKGDVYVADTAGAENKISKYDAEGKLVESWGKEGQLDGSAVTEGPFKSIEGMAVDPAGNLWVLGGPGEARLFEFDQAGGFAEERTIPLGTQPTGVALDGAEPEHIYMLHGFAWGPIRRLALVTGLDEGAVFGTEHTFFTGIAADRRTHDLFADQEGISIAAVPLSCKPVSNGTAGACSPAQVFGEGDLKEGAGLGVDSATDTIYVALAETDRIAVFPVTLEGITGAASAVTAEGATLHGTIDPRGTPITHCALQFGETEGYGQEVPCTPATPISSPTAIQADLHGLNGGTTYHYRLRLGNEAHEFLSSEDATFKTPTIATIEEVKADEITESSAKLSAKVNPNGVAGTTCSAEWGTTTSYGTTVPCEPSSLSGSAAVEVTTHLTGLSPGTVYHYRFVVSDTNGIARTSDHSLAFLREETLGGCTNETVREENESTKLPDCRAYELVTPMNKNGSLIGALFANNTPPQIAGDGTRVIAPAIQCFADSLSCVGTRIAEGEPFQFERAGSGWATEALAIPASVYETSSAWGFNADTGFALFGSPSPPDGQDDWYVREPGTGSLSDLGPLSEAVAEIGLIGSEPIVTTADFSHVMWMEGKPLWSFDEPLTEGLSLYEYPGPEGSSSEPQLVAVSGGAGSHDLIGTCGSVVAGFESRTQTFGSLSADGHTSFFRVEPCEHGAGENKSRQVYSRYLFARIDGEGPDARTIAISEPSALSPAQPNPACTSTQCLSNTSKATSFRDAEFQGASTDGTLAYFSSPQQLTDSASQDPNSADTPYAAGCAQTKGANGCNLYLFTSPQQKPLSGTHLFDISAGDSSGIGPEVQGMLALSTDGTHAYFVAKGVLSATSNSEGDHAVEGANNLYLYERDASHPSGQVTFVARLAASDNKWSNGMEAANVTPDGRFLVFESSRGLTPDARSGGPRQIYRYDAVANKLERISFGSRGFNDDGNAGGTRANARVAPVLNTTVFRYGPVRSDPTMSDDGSTVFFQSPVALTLGAVAEAPAGGGGLLVENIYEWEEDRHGSCTEEGGCVYLLTDGKDTAEGGNNDGNVVELLGSDVSGENVFFATSSRLNPHDTDTQRDYYDARARGGFSVPIPAEACEGEACRSAPSAPPVFGPLGSFSFSGPGNLAQLLPAEKPPVVKPPEKLTKAQLLKKALRACKTKPKVKRKACERAASRKYGRKSKKRKGKR